MATKTSGEIEQEFIENLKNTTGNSLKEWMAKIAGFGSGKRNEIVKRLKEANGFGHMNATLLAGIYLNGGKAVYGSTDALLENQFAKADAMRPLYESFTTFVKKHFPNSTVLPKKTYVSILEKREFAAINIKPKELRIGFDLGERPFDESVGKSKMSGPMPRISHMLVISEESQLGDELVQLLKQSHGRCH
jgi:predicted transport protein